ncbi:MAG: methionyl-tRNA formyltransferase [Oscillospiraceae bacterium]|nr:methionyl-tRNA formyltransferase [Oscillospiraceae bacterium]
MRIVFMGTPELAADILRALSAEFDVCGVFCQPDRPVGRKQILTPPPTKVLAEKLGIPVFQPKGFRNGKAAQVIRDLEPDLIAVVAYGRILPQEVLDIPRLGCVNLHGSILPAYRGAAPVQRAIMAGEKITGLTAIMMDAGMDTGDIIDVLEIPSGDMDADAMFRKMGEEGGPFLCRVIRELEAGTAERRPQNGSEATMAPPIEKSEGEFDFTLSAERIVGLVRGLSMWPVASFAYEDKRIKVCSAALSELTGEPGEILSLSPLTVAAPGGSVVIGDVIPQGSRRMTGAEWARGRRLAAGNRIGNDA